MSTASPSAPHARPVYGQTWPTLDVFGVLARDRRVIPVVRRLMADAETPVGVYRKLAGDRPGTFLLESAEHGGVWSRYSIVGAASRATLTERDGQAHWIGEPPVGVPTTGLATEALRGTWRPWRPSRSPGLPPLTGGMVGAITYDAVRRWERVPEHHPRRARPARARDDARHRPRRARPHRRLGAARRQRRQLRRHRRAGRARLGRRRGPARRHDPRAGRARREHRRGRRHRAVDDADGAGALEHHPRALRGDRRARQGGHPRRRGLPGRALAAVLDATAPPTRSTSTARCARATPARTCTSSGSRTPTARRTTSSAAAPRRSSR